MDSINFGDIVAFNETADQLAAVFCRNKGITGRVISEEAGLLVINVGFDYKVYAKPSQLRVVATKSQIPEPVDVGN